MAQVQLVGVSKHFGSTIAVQALDLDIADGEFFTLLGGSGCGKSTTLHLIAGLETPSSGHVLFDGEEVTALSPRERNVAVVFQSYALYPHKTVAGHLAFPLLIGHVPKAEIDAPLRDQGAAPGHPYHVDLRHPRSRRSDGALRPHRSDADREGAAVCVPA